MTVIVWCAKVHACANGCALLNGWKQYNIPNSRVTTNVFELAPHRSNALHSHIMFAPTALEDHNRGIRNTAHRETETCEFGICRANRDVSTSICAL